MKEIKKLKEYLMETRNAVIESTSLGYEGYEGHGILTYSLILKYDKSSRQSFGGYALDRPVLDEKKNFKCREGSAYGMESIARILNVVGVESWEKLVGKSLRVRASRIKVEAIGNFLEDKWFFPQTSILHLLTE